MSGSVNTKLNPFSGDDYVREVEMVCDMHRIPFGSPETLAGFVHALDENKPLAMDFWSLVARMGDIEGPDESNQAGDIGTRVLNKIVEGVSGQSVADVLTGGGDAARSVRDLASLLAGEDIYAPEASQMPVPPTKASAAGGPLPFAPILSFAAMKQTAIAEAAAVETPPPVAEFLNDPEVETPKVVPQPEADAPLPRHNEYKRSVLRSELPSVGRLVRATVSSDALHKAPRAKTQHAEERPLTVSMQAYEEPSDKPGNLRFALLWLLGILVMVGVGYFTCQHGMEVWQQFNSGLHIISGGSSASTVDRVVQAPVAPSTSAVPPAVAVAPATPLIADRKPPASRDSVDSRLGTGRAVPVPHSVMQANLISSRTPIYPDIARKNGIKGRVVLQVIVLKNGTVGKMRVVAGNAELSNAAMQAVAKWRYRPYLLNGEPVNVSTLVTVDLPLAQ